VRHKASKASLICRTYYVRAKGFVLSPNSTWLVTSRLDATRHVRRVECVETSVWNRAVRQARLCLVYFAKYVEVWLW